MSKLKKIDGLPFQITSAYISESTAFNFLFLTFKVKAQ